MPRQSRIDLPDTVYHVYTRGHNKSTIFGDDTDRRKFLTYLKRSCTQYPCQILGYCLMDNHYHLQVKTLSSPLGKTLHHLNTLYAGYFNFRYGTVGHVFQNRFHSIPVEVDSYLLVLSRYIHLNPVAAGLVSKPEDYRWSSYGDYLGISKDNFIKTELVLDTLDANPIRQRETYRSFVDNGILKPPDITEKLIQKTRVFGSATFANSLLGTVPTDECARV